MATTVQEVFNITMALADEIDDTGTINITNTASYRVRTPGIITVLQSELIKEGDLFSTHNISNKPASVIANGTNVEEFVGTDINKEAFGKVHAYYFEAIGAGTVLVQDFTGGWNTLATINIPDTVTTFTAYTGIITPTLGATTSRFVFTGSYRYLVTNYALFTAPFQTVPTYRPYVKKTMPSDFKSVDQIVAEYADTYTKESDYKWEGRGDLYMNYSYSGNLRIVYRPIPIPIANLTDILVIDDITARTLIPYGLGMELFKEENADIYAHFKARYDELKMMATIKQPAVEQHIINVYGTFNAN